MPPTSAWNVVRDGLWLLAIAVEYGAGFFVLRSWPIRSARLWSERHQIIVMVALGEAFIGLGLGGTARAVLARDAYSFLHLPIVGGILLFSLGLKKTLAFLEHFRKRDALDVLTLCALYGGVVLFLLGVMGFRRRIMGRVSRLRLVLAVLLVALAPVGRLVPAYVAFGVLAALAVGLVAVEFGPQTALRRRLRESLTAQE